MVLIDFWTYSCINCLRTLPWVRAWAAKYRDATSGKTWSGRGRKPGWFVNALAEGKSLESLAA